MTVNKRPHQLPNVLSQRELALMTKLQLDRIHSHPHHEAYDSDNLTDTQKLSTAYAFLSCFRSVEEVGYRILDISITVSDEPQAYYVHFTVCHVNPQRDREANTANVSAALTDYIRKDTRNPYASAHILHTASVGTVLVTYCLPDVVNSYDLIHVDFIGR